MHVRRRTGQGRRALLPAVGLAAVVLATATGSLQTPEPTHPYHQIFRAKRARFRR